ncbi:MAG: ComC/BlpC family leader-containing pheromone/bacteriocin [Myxococcales bacterium]|nr:ComC/BlpC family leader-containing pheromone/bacteriocin [Myxococcales bacterium]
MSTDFATIDTTALTTITGGLGADVNANVNVSGDLNKPIGALDQLGTAASRVIGCATGASSMREFGNCMLTGQLGNVPAAPGAAPGGQ